MDIIEAQQVKEWARHFDFGVNVMSKLFYPPEYDTTQLERITNKLIGKFKSGMKESECLEILNDALAKSIKHFDEKRGCFYALYQLNGKRLLINAQRDKYHRKRAFNHTAASIDDACHSVNIFSYPEFEQADFKTIASKAGLHEKAIMVLELHYLDNLTLVEVAKELNITVALVKYVIEYAINYLREHMPKDAFERDKSFKPYHQPDSIEWARYEFTQASVDLEC